ncbi:3-hydroxyacyl-CoA dehydrogenase [Defluviimonas denitrificans]|jgi:3-hydroxyacyl-CoA dehydrogenase|uniref:3-hydroxyacyl-CoA dehydrogenase n=1 Tax=Albidovulum denitrificans TaxID=404881 RepID=A0A2S8SCR1_9RHOB|nr:enoyl-CoA hydratase-related protein [Defluviimonas denitrificans]PQV58586.1 3-hydroxyacyl-CoA dehydrogenase [Defluviimonas denitrificans]
MEPVSLRAEAGIGWITIDNPPVNALSHGVCAGLADAVERAAADREIKVIVLRGAGRVWSAGADVRDLDTAPSPLPALCAKLAGLETPVIAALHGSVLGGALELALCARLRIAAPGTQLGFPDVSLGLLPGAGGTQRLPRLIGAKAALGMMLSGLPVNAERAEAMGLVDAVIEGDLDAMATRLAEAHIDGTAPLPTWEERAARPEPGEWLSAIEAARSGLGRARLPAPVRIIDCVEAALLLPEAEGHVFEATAFAELAATPESVGLRHAFLAELRAAHAPGGAAPRALAEIGLVGTGAGAAPLAAGLLSAGMRVTMIEGDSETLADAMSEVAILHDRAVESGRLTPAAREEEWARIDGSVDLRELERCDLVLIEDADGAVEVGRLLAALDRVIRPEAVRAVLLAGGEIGALAGASAHPGAVIGLRMAAEGGRLAEVVGGPETAAEAIATGLAFLRKLGRMAVAVPGGGAIGAALMGALITAADSAVAAGASPYDVDRALAAWGFARGPYQQADLAGLDPKGWLGAVLVAAGRTGHAEGKGVYSYGAGQRMGHEDDEVLALIAAAREAQGIVARPVGMKEIQTRALAALANAGARLVEAGEVARPSDIDAVAIAGIGFPRWRGGPICAADQAGPLAVRSELRRFAAGGDDFWTPAALWDELVKYGRHLGDRAG